MRLDGSGLERLLDLGSVPSLVGTGRATVLFTWTCETQWYQYHLGPTLNEALLLVPEGGALASVGPAGISRPYLQSLFGNRVYENFFRSGMSLGEAIRWAKVDSLASDPAARPVVEGWGLLGDPALRLPGGVR